MTKVKMLTVSAGPKGILRIGDIIDVSDGEAKLLIDGNLASAIDKPKLELPKPKTTKKKV